MARFRKTAVAAVAVSAVVLTPSAAYARDFGLNDFARQGSTMSSMSWGTYRGELTDLSPNTTDVKTTDMFDGARATAVMISMGRAATSSSRSGALTRLPLARNTVHICTTESAWRVMGPRQDLTTTRRETPTVLRQ